MNEWNWMGWDFRGDQPSNCYQVLCYQIKTILIDYDVVCEQSVSDDRPQIDFAAQ
jgi:hypothetical protein